MSPILAQSISSISLVIWLFLLANWIIWRRQVPGSKGRYASKSRAMLALYPSLIQIVAPALRDAVQRDTNMLTYLAAGMTIIAWLFIHHDLSKDTGDHYFTNWREHLGLRPSTT